MIVVVDTDMNVPDEVSQLAIELHDSSRVDQHPTMENMFRENIVSPSDLPLTMGVYPTSDPESEFRLSVFARLNNELVAHAAVRTRFIEGEARVLRLTVERSCRNVECNPPGLSCRAGECTSEAVDPETYPLWDGSDPAM
ncbi:MAG: hypothetical protein AAGF12_29980 [Myxococcota bacterium]